MKYETRVEDFCDEDESDCFIDEERHVKWGEIFFKKNLMIKQVHNNKKWWIEMRIKSNNDNRLVFDLEKL